MAELMATSPHKAKPRAREAETEIQENGRGVASVEWDAWAEVLDWRLAAGGWRLALAESQV